MFLSLHHHPLDSLDLMPRGKFDVPATVEFESLLTWQSSHGNSCKEGIGCTNIGGDERGRAAVGIQPIHKRWDCFGCWSGVFS